MKVLTIALNGLRRLARDRIALFFAFFLPLLMIVVIGAVFGSAFEPRIGVLALDAGPLSTDLRQSIETIENARVTGYTSRRDLLEDLRRDELEAGVVIPTGYDSAIRGGGSVSLTYIAVPTGAGFEVQALVQAVVADQAARVRAARFASSETGATFDEGLAAASTAVGLVPGLSVAVVGPGGGAPAAAGQFDQGAAQQLILFSFITSMAAATALIQSRRLRVSHRMLATPTSTGVVIAGETLGRFLIAMTQGLFIVGAATLLFGVGWGDWPATIALVTTFSLVGTGAAMLIGSVFNNDEQAGGIAVFASLALGALGGCMVPLEVFGDTMRRVAHITPHAWALDGFSEIIRKGGSLADIIPELGVLLAFAVVLLALATGLFHRTITR